MQSFRQHVSFICFSARKFCCLFVAVIQYFVKMLNMLLLYIWILEQSYTYKILLFTICISVQLVFLCVLLFLFASSLTIIICTLNGRVYIFCLLLQGWGLLSWYSYNIYPKYKVQLAGYAMLCFLHIKHSFQHVQFFSDDTDGTKFISIFFLISKMQAVPPWYVGTCGYIDEYWYYILCHWHDFAKI